MRYAKRKITDELRKVLDVESVTIAQSRALGSFVLLEGTKAQLDAARPTMIAAGRRLIDRSEPEPFEPADALFGDFYTL